MLSGLMQRLRSGLEEQAARFARDAGFMKATMAACALMAAADGEIEEAEKKKTAGYIERSPDLKNFDRTECLRAFSAFAEELQFDFDMGKDSCLKAIGSVTDPEKANLVMRLAIAIARSDGEFEADEKRVAGEIAKRLGLPPHEYGL